MQNFVQSRTVISNSQSESNKLTAGLLLMSIAILLISPTIILHANEDPLTVLPSLSVDSNIATSPDFERPLRPGSFDLLYNGVLATVLVIPDEKGNNQLSVFIELPDGTRQEGFFEEFIELSLIKVTLNNTGSVDLDLEDGGEQVRLTLFTTDLLDLSLLQELEGRQLNLTNSALINEDGSTSLTISIVPETSEVDNTAQEDFLILTFNSEGQLEAAEQSKVFVDPPIEETPELVIKASIPAIFNNKLGSVIVYDDGDGEDRLAISLGPVLDNGEELRVPLSQTTSFVAQSFSLNAIGTIDFVVNDEGQSISVRFLRDPVLSFATLATLSQLTQKRLTLINSPVILDNNTVQISFTVSSTVEGGDEGSIVTLYFDQQNRLTKASSQL
jgi:hypothetical protein